MSKERKSSAVLAGVGLSLNVLPGESPHLPVKDLRLPTEKIVAVMAVQVDPTFRAGALRETKTADGGRGTWRAVSTRPALPPVVLPAPLITAVHRPRSDPCCLPLSVTQSVPQMMSRAPGEQTLE